MQRMVLRAVADVERWAGESRGRSERGRSEVVGLVREVLQVTAVHPASCGGVTAVREPAQQRVQPTRPLRPFWA
jgi:hypothetical protein